MIWAFQLDRSIGYRAAHSGLLLCLESQMRCVEARFPAFDMYAFCYIRENFAPRIAEPLLQCHYNDNDGLEAIVSFNLLSGLRKLLLSNGSHVWNSEGSHGKSPSGSVPSPLIGIPVLSL